LARKFLYFIAFVIVLVIAAAFALRLWPQQLSELAFVPKTAFEQQAPLAAGRYDDPAMWISRPGKGAEDPALWLPDGVKQNPAPPKAVVFFIHPTSYLAKTHWNAPLADQDSQAMADILVRGLASPFNAVGNIWVPRYRQAAFGAFLTSKPEGQRALDLAYGDVLQAFDAFLASTRQDQPIILVGHSQGAMHLMRLMKDRVAGKPLARRIVAAYPIGWPVSLTHDLPAMGLPACTAPAQTGCVISWVSFADPADPAMMQAAYARSPGLDGQKRGGSAFLCTNPLNGGAGGIAPASTNLGTLKPDVQMKSGKLVAGMVPARCGADGFLSVGSPPNLGPFVLPGNNYHIYDIPLFWANIRADALSRMAAWKP